MGRAIVKFGGAAAAATLVCQQPQSVSVAEKAGARTISQVLRQTFAVLQITIQEQITPATGQQIGTSLRVQLSLDNGADWTDLGSYAPDRTDEDSTHTYYVTTVCVPNILILSGTQQVKARAWAVAATNDPGPAAAVTSAEFGLSAQGLPANNLITALTITAPGNGNWPYNASTADGMQYPSIASISYNDTGAVADVNAYFVRVTVRDKDANHNYVGPEKPYSGFVISASGQVQQCGGLAGVYGVSPGDTAATAYWEFAVYVCNRNDSGPMSFQDATCATLQTSIGTGGRLEVLIAAGAAPPPGALAGSRVSGAVAQATSATSATTAISAASATTASSATYATSAGSATSASLVPGSGIIGQVTLGGGGTATTVNVVKDSGGNVVCWMGQYAVSGTTYYGIWAQNFWAGGSGPATAKIWLDSSGNAHLSGYLESGSTITSPSIIGGSLTGSSLSISTASGTVSINSATYGVAISSSSTTSIGWSVTCGNFSVTANATQLTASYSGSSNAALNYVGLTCTYGSQSATYSYSGVSCSSGSVTTGYLYVDTSATFYSGVSVAFWGPVSFYSAVSFSGSISPAGVSCPSYGISCYSLAAGAGGISVNGSTRIDASGQFYPYRILYSPTLIAGSGGDMPSSYSNALYINDQYGNYLGKCPMF